MLKKINDAIRANNHQMAIEYALSLSWKNEVRADGAVLVSVSALQEVQETHTLAIKWKARYIHPWDRMRNCSDEEQFELFHMQCFSDTEAILFKLFESLPGIEAIRFSVIRPDHGEQLLSGTVERSALKRVGDGASTIGRLRQMGIDVTGLPSSLHLTKGKSIG